MPDNGGYLLCDPPGQCPVCGLRDDSYPLVNVTKHYTAVQHITDNSHRWEWWDRVNAPPKPRSGRLVWWRRGRV